MAQSELGGARISNIHHNRRSAVVTGMTSDSASGSDDAVETSPYAERRKNMRVWKSNPDLVRVNGGHVGDHSGEINSRASPYPPKATNGISKVNGSAKAISETDLRSTAANGGANGHANGYTGGFGTKVNSMPNGSAVVANGAPPKHPHLVVRNLTYDLDKTTACRTVCGGQRQKLRILDSVAFEVRAGELLAIMATNAREGSAILDVLSNRYDRTNGKVKGEFILNGTHLTSAKLSDLVAYVNQDTQLCPEMTARQTILFTTLLQRASSRQFDTKKRTNALLEELGLSEVRHTSVRSLTEAERRRLLIAVALMLDTDLLLLDQPVKGMDIFDTFFLIEYLRQWALISGRCVILTIQPATYEIFTMLSRVALVSTGRVLFHGKRKDLLSYFSYIDYPCPAFKNPSDYYLDLVTLDNLSSEAMLESSQR